MKKSGLVLNAEQVQEIYRCKIQLLQPHSFGSCLQSAQLRIRGQSVPVAKRFGVSPKTVRDIWSRRTWTYTTEQLWTEEASLSSHHCVAVLSVRLSDLILCSTTPLHITHPITSRFDLHWTYSSEGDDPKAPKTASPD